MSIASILAIVEGDETTSAVMRTAFDLAKRNDAYLEVLHIQPDPREGIPLVGEGMTGTMVAQVMNEIRERGEAQAAEARRLFEENCKARDVPVEDAAAHAPARGRAGWRLVEGRAEIEVAERGLLFDLIVMAQPDREREGAYASALETALFDVGGPVLVVPAGYTGPLGEKAVVSWNGRREAARAVTAALPLLQHAQQVTIISVEENGYAADPQSLLSRLQLHHIKADCRTIGGGQPAAEALLAEVKAVGADLLVMGAYGHSRLRQFVVGGVTRRLLAEAPVPLLMAH